MISWILNTHTHTFSINEFKVPVNPLTFERSSDLSHQAFHIESCLTAHWTYDKLAFIDIREEFFSTFEREPFLCSVNSILYVLSSKLRVESQENSSIHFKIPKNSFGYRQVKSSFHFHSDNELIELWAMRTSVVILNFGHTHTIMELKWLKNSATETN